MWRERETETDRQREDGARVCQLVWIVYDIAHKGKEDYGSSLFTVPRTYHRSSDSP